MEIGNINDFAYISLPLTSTPIRAICVHLPGHGCQEMREWLDVPDLKYAHAGMLFVYPYVNPWNWMNEFTVDFLDALLTKIKQAYNLEACPLLLRGSSMGGYSALVYAMFGKHKPDAVLAICPVTDAVFHFSASPGNPRSFCFAMGDYGDISQKLRERSPNYHVELLPQCPYCIIHGGHDTAVSKTAHSDKLVTQMKHHGLNVIYVEDENMEHGFNVSYETTVAQDSFISSFLRQVK